MYFDVLLSFNYLLNTKYEKYCGVCYTLLLQLYIYFFVLCKFKDTYFLSCFIYAGVFNYNIDICMYKNDF